VRREGIPQGLKPHFLPKCERAKAEALAYLEAKTQKQDEALLQ
jgi:hypothetical protein